MLPAISVGSALRGFRAEAGELPEPVHRSVDEPVDEDAERAGDSRAGERRAAPDRAQGRDERGDEAGPEQQRSHDPGLAEGPQLDAVGVAWLLVAPAALEVGLLEVVGADPSDRLGREAIRGDAPEVVSVGAERLDEADATAARRRGAPEAPPGSRDR